MEIADGRLASAVWLAAITLCLEPTVRGAEPGLTIEDAVRSSLRHPRMRAAEENVRQARAEAQSARLLPNPTLSIEGGLLPLSRSFSPEKPAGPSELSGSLSFPIDWLIFGKRSAAIDAGEAGVQAALDEYAEAVRQRSLETVIACYDLLEWRTLAQTAQETVDDLLLIERAVQAAAESGGRSQLDVARVRLAVLAAQREARAAEAEKEAAAQRLSSLLEPGTAAAASTLVGSLDDPLPASDFSVEETYRSAAQSRPDIQALRHKSARARAIEASEDRNAWPEASVGLNVTHQFQEPIGAPDATAFGVAFEMALPFFDRNQGNRARARSAAAQADFELTAALNELRTEVQIAAQTLAAAEHNARLISDQELSLAAQIRTILQTARDSGGRPMIELLDAHQSYRESYRAYVSSRADYWRARARFQATIGKKVIP